MTKTCFHCANPVLALGFCRMHYARHRRGRPMSTPPRKSRALTKTISVCLSQELVDALSIEAESGLSSLIRTILLQYWLSRADRAPHKLISARK